MHKQFQKFGFFVSKNEEPQPKSEDKYIKYLYKKESFDRIKKKIKSVNEEDKRKEERHSKRKSSNSTARKLTKTSNLSTTELFFISPDEIKRHRRKKEKEKSPERPQEKKNISKTEADVIKFIKHQREREDGYEWLTKKDIFKLINKARDPNNTSPSSSFLKKFFHFEEAKTEFAPLDIKHVKPKNEDSAKNEKRRPRKDESVNVVFTREHRTRQEASPNVRKHHEVPKIKQHSDDLKKNKNEDDVRTKKKELEKRLQNVSRTNPLRHRKCLVKNTFSIVDIVPSVHTDDFLEKKKKLKAFKKYYKYSRMERDSNVTPSITCHTFSDSHKMYQPMESVDDVKKRHKKKSRHEDEEDKYQRKRAERKTRLKLETNVSSVVITPTLPSKEEKSHKSKKSKIPIPNNKMVELARDTSPKSRSRRKSADLFNPKQEEKKKSVKKPQSPPISEKSSVATGSVKPPIKTEAKESKISNLSKPTKREKTPSPPQTYRKNDNNQHGVKSASIDGTSSVWSRNSKKTNRSLSSKSDTRISPKKKVPEQKFKAIGSSAKTSRSNSTCGDKSLDSKAGTSFFVTKTFKDDEKLSRWHKRKEYADNVRRNAINKAQKSVVPRQVLEVRYLTLTKNDVVAESQEAKEFFEEDLPKPCVKSVEDEKFKELFELPTDQALNEILKENNNFLKKDFSFNADDIPRSPEDLSSDDGEDSCSDWYNFGATGPLSFSEISCYRRNSSLTNLGSQDHIVDSLSAPGSEESGYSTIKSRTVSRSFFERPCIKSLLRPSSFVHIKSSSSYCGVELRSIESKSLQTCPVESSQKSVQIKMSQEEVLEMISFSGKDAEEKTKEVVEEAVEVKQEVAELPNEEDGEMGHPQTEQVKKLSFLEKIKRKLSFLSCFSGSSDK